MASGKNIKTYFNGEWKDENTATIKAADHGAWLGTRSLPPFHGTCFQRQAHQHVFAPGPGG